MAGRPFPSKGYSAVHPCGLPTSCWLRTAHPLAARQRKAGRKRMQHVPFPMVEPEEESRGHMHREAHPNLLNSSQLRDPRPVRRIPLNGVPSSRSQPGRDRNPALAPLQIALEVKQTGRQQQAPLRWGSPAISPRVNHHPCRQAGGRMIRLALRQGRMGEASRMTSCTHERPPVLSPLAATTQRRSFHGPVMQAGAFRNCQARLPSQRIPPRRRASLETWHQRRDRG
jgi:hypothetical protein